MEETQVANLILIRDGKVLVLKEKGKDVYFAYRDIFGDYKHCCFFIKVGIVLSFLTSFKRFLILTK